MVGKLIFFLLEVNFGFGLGVLLVFMFFGKGVVKFFVLGVIIIYFFGGIYEIYFLYVMMKLLLFLLVIVGGVIGSLVF